MRRRLAVTVVISALAVLAAGAASGAGRAYRPTCKSGRTLLHKGSVRVFRVSYDDRAVKGRHQALLACRGSRRPLTLVDPGPFNAAGGERFSLHGDRLGFVAHVQGLSSGSHTEIGWADLRVRRVRSGLINAGENADAGDPLLPEDHIGYAIGADGAIAFISGDACQVVGLLPTRSTPLDGRRLGPPAVLFTADHGGLDASSIALTGSAVTWRATNGTPAALPRPSGDPGPVVSPTGGC